MADGRSDAAFVEAARLAAAGEVGAARELLDGLETDSDLDRARALRLGASLARLDGDPVTARHRAVRARELAEAAGHPALALEAQIELAEDRLANGEHLAAAQEFARAETESAHEPLAARAALRVKQAEALAAAGRFTPAADVLEITAGRADTAGDERLAAELLVQAVTVAQRGGRRNQVERLDGRARSVAEHADHRGALAELDVLAAARALDDGDAERALAATASARGHALAAVQPLTYAAAVLSASGIRDRTGDRAGAYRELARGWATVGDLLGADVARATFEPPLQELRGRWGAEEFAHIKGAYEAARRAPT